MIRQMLIGLIAGGIAVGAMALLRPSPRLASPPGTVVVDGRPSPADRPSLSAASAPVAPDPLDRTFDQFKARNEPALGLLKRLADEAKLNLVINRDALDTTDLGSNVPVSCDLHNVTIRGALDAIFVALGDTNELRMLGYRVSGGTVIVSSSDRARHRPILRVYDVSDLVDYMVRSVPEEAPMEDPTGLHCPSPDPGLRPREALFNLVDLIRSTVSPDSWRDCGGTIGSIRVVGQRLVVQGDEDMHRQIAELLYNLREGYRK